MHCAHPLKQIHFKCFKTEMWVCRRFLVWCTLHFQWEPEQMVSRKEGTAAAAIWWIELWVHLFFSLLLKESYFPQNIQTGFWQHLWSTDDVLAKLSFAEETPAHNQRQYMPSYDVVRYELFIYKMWLLSGFCLYECWCWRCRYGLIFSLFQCAIYAKLSCGRAATEIKNTQR